MNKRLCALCFAGLALAGGPALAEGGYDGLGQALALFAITSILYLALVIALIAFAVTRNKKAFWRLAIIGVGITLVLPMIDSGLLAWQERRVAEAEIRKPAPDLRDQQILIITPRGGCNHSLCAAIMLLREEQPMWALTSEAVAKLDLSQPIDLSTVPLQQYVALPNGARSYNPQEPAADTARPIFDYVIISQSPFYLSRAEDVEAALPQMPKGTLLGDKLLLQALAAPLSDQTLDLGALDPDYLTFYVPRSAFKPPLFPENTNYGTSITYEWRKDRQDWFCGTDDLTQSQYQCSHALD